MLYILLTFGFNKTYNRNVYTDNVFVVTSKCLINGVVVFVMRYSYYVVTQLAIGVATGSGMLYLIILQ